MPRHVTPGSTLTDRHLTPVVGAPVAVPAPDRLIHLQFRRFAGCPVCNLHLRSIVRRHAEIEAAGVREVVVFHSPADELREHTHELPFAVVADPDKRLYREFGVESSRRSLLSPRAWLPILRAVAHSSWGLLRGRDRAPSRTQAGGRLGLPADFLIASDGRVLAAKYGEHVYDQWSVDELLDLAGRSADRTRTGSATA
ncbi:peroxiredoxin-like family protein [Micromonospora coxensis]|uniref:peroxiredoxin-like family protein n=1 Tax=Micromonospora coxensis TaxID=356852 RepID=UPI00343B07DA